MSPAAWVSRLDKRLSKLTESASKESVQTLAKWIGFRRRHSEAFAQALAVSICDPKTTVSRRTIYLQVVHETLVLDSRSEKKWDRYSDLREILGEKTLLVVVGDSTLDGATVKKIEGYVKQWDDLNVFGGPTWINRIRKVLSSPPSQKDKSISENDSSPPLSETISGGRTKAPHEKIALQSPTSKSDGKNVFEHEGSAPRDSDSGMKTKASETDAISSTGESQKAMVSTQDEAGQTSSDTGSKSIVYDFESKGIPAGKVEAREFLAPCKAIATLHIARDLRNDAAIQLSASLGSMPDDLKMLCEEADKEVNDGKNFSLSIEKAMNFAMRTSEDLLDMDVDEQLDNVRTFREIVEKQTEARKALIFLLIKSRCNFGADDAASSFYQLDQTMEQLRQRKETLLDAMALEGLDFDEKQTKETQQNQVKLEPLDWFQPSEPDAKRIRIT